MIALRIKKKKHFAQYFRKSAPQFLLDIYNKLTTQESDEIERVKRDTSENEVYLSPADEYAIDQSDNIMTFLNKSEILLRNLYFCA